VQMAAITAKKENNKGEKQSQNHILISGPLTEYKPAKC